ncbi:T9SS type A sorting domain-containing protein [Aureispira]|nr:T9SS type A sorting domain-containing protein [Aureispira sp.]
MKITSLLAISSVFIFGFIPLNGQNWVEKMQYRSSNVNDVIMQFDSAWGTRPYQRGYGWKQFKRWQDFWEPRVYPHGLRPPNNHAWKEHLKFKRTFSSEKGVSRSSNWTSMGPDSWTTTSYNPGIGRVNVIAEDPNDPNTIYIGAPAGGCWKSTNAGVNWTVLTDDFQSLGVSAIAIDYTNSNVIYIGTGDDDGGDTYSVGMFKSIDGGITWNEVSPSSSTIFGNSINKIIIHPIDNNTVFIASSTGCHKSTNGGNTWTLLQSGAWRDMELKPDDPNTIYLSSKIFYRSTDGGLSWSNISTGLPNSFNINRAEIAVTAANPDYVYFLCGDYTNASFYGLYRSDNGGTSFSLQANSPNIFAYDMTGSDANSGQSWFDMALTVSPTNAEEIYVGGINVWQSLDGGVSYTIKTHWVYPATVGYVHADIHFLEFIGTRLYCGSDGGIFKSVDNGNSFNDLSSGLSISQFYNIGSSEQVPHKVVGGTQDNGTNLINNGSALHIRGGDGMYAIISPEDSLVMYTSTQNGNFKRTDDGGYHFVDIFPSQSGNGAWVAPLVINPMDHNMLLAGFSEVYFSLDKGLSDAVISSFNTGDLLRNLAIAPSAGFTHFYAGTYDNLFATTNSGAAWTNITSGLPSVAMTSVTVHPTNPLKIWVTFSGVLAGEKVYLSDDGGISWTNISDNLPNLSINCLAFQDGGGVYIGTDVGVYYRDSLLAGWQQFMTGLPNVIVQDLEINYTAGKIRAGTFGRGLWESDLQQPLSAPPIANFSYGNTQICTSDSIEFTDVSIDHAPGWTWYFPGGSPSSSTLRNPKVYYPVSGVYSVKLVVQNPIGSDSITKVLPIVYKPNALDFDLQLDNNAVEVSWNLADSVGNILFESAIFMLAGQDSQLIEKDLCVAPGCYTLTMIDFGFNGLCCAHGVGYYLLRDINGDTLAYGSSYNNLETTTFCVSDSVALAAGGSVIHSVCGMNSGSIDVSAIGGSGSYQYSIDNGVSFQSSSVFDNLSPGTYLVLVQDALSQQFFFSLIVNETDIPEAIASASGTVVYLNQGGLVNFFSTNSAYASSVLWSFPGGTTSSLENPDFTFANGGLQQVILNVTNGNCTDSDTLNINVIDNVNIEEIENAVKLSIIPNPINDKFFLEIEFPKTEDGIEIVIHNSLGQRVFWESVQTIKRYKKQLHFGNEPNGLYYITVFTESSAISKKFLKG